MIGIWNGKGIESCNELDEVEMDEVEAGPGFGCTSPDIIRRTHNQSEKVTIATVTKQSCTNLVLRLI